MLFKRRISSYRPHLVPANVLQEQIRQQAAAHGLLPLPHAAGDEEPFMRAPGPAELSAWGAPFRTHRAFIIVIINSICIL